MKVANCSGPQGNSQCPLGARSGFVTYGIEDAAVQRSSALIPGGGVARLACLPGKAGCRRLWEPIQLMRQWRHIGSAAPNDWCEC